MGIQKVGLPWETEQLSFKVTNQNDLQQPHLQRYHRNILRLTFQKKCRKWSYPIPLCPLLCVHGTNSTAQHNYFELCSGCWIPAGALTLSLLGGHVESIASSCRFSFSLQPSMYVKFKRKNYSKGRVTDRSTNKETERFSVC